MLIVVSLILVLFTWQGSAQCPSGWTRHETSCYHFSHDTEPWILAQQTCTNADDGSNMEYIRASPLLVTNIGPFLDQYDITLPSLDPHGTNVHANLQKEVCKTFGGILADITSKSEDTYLQNEVQRLKMNHWVGGNDLMNEGEWKWVSTNEDVDYTNWLVGEPNNRVHNENCMDLRSTPGWNDERCDISQFYICEQPAQDESIVG